VTIYSPAAAIFAFVADGLNAPRWRPGVLDIHKQSGNGVGAVYAQGVKGPGGRRISADYEITAFEPPTKLEFRAIAGPVRPIGGYRLAESDGRTDLTFWLRAEIGGWKSLVMGRSVQSTMDAEMQALDRLKAVLEQSGG
jgi:hypothetical protein